MNKKLILLTASLVAVTTVASVAVFVNQANTSIKAEENTYTLTIDHDAIQKDGYKDLVYTEGGNAIEIARTNCEKEAPGLGVFHGNGSAFYLNEPIKHVISAVVTFTKNGEYDINLSLTWSNTSQNFTDATYRITDIESGATLVVPEGYEADDQYFCLWYTSAGSKEANGILIESIVINYSF